MTTSVRIKSHEPMSFGRFLRFLRRRARLTQRELAIAVNYSEGQVCHLENDRRVPELTTLAALFVPALGLEDAPDDTARLLALAAGARAIPNKPESSTADRKPRPTVQRYVAPLVGRAAQRAALRDMLVHTDVRLVTVIGPPGVGKTHLAQQLAHDLHEQFRDGAVFVDLTAVDDAALVPQTIASVLDLGEEPGTTAAHTLEQALASREMLVVLDNFEQVVDAAPLLQRLLASAHGLTLLLTSRVVLRLREEHVWSLPPLAVPDLALLPPLDHLAQNDAMALLLARLRLVDPTLELTSANALALAAICVRVDGLPLALEFVASRGRLLSPQELLTDVAQQFGHMRRRGRDVPDRHRSLAASLQWSHDYLAPAAQAVFARLSVFVGHWSIDLVAPVCDIENAGRAAIYDHLEDLIEHSLLQRHTHDGETYLSMLTMVREYAAERLAERSEQTVVRTRLIDAVTTFAERAEQHFIVGDEQAAWMNRANRTYDTVRVALHAALERGATTEGLRLVGALWRYWYLRGLLREGRHWLETLLELPGGPDRVRAHALDGAGILAWRQGDHAQSRAWLRAALALYQHTGDQRGESRVLDHLGLLFMDTGASDDAQASFEASLALSRATGDEAGETAAMHNLANIFCQQNDNGRALELYRACLARYQQQGRDADIALINLGIGVIHRDWGEGDAAQAAFAASLDLARTVGDEWTEATALLNLGDLASDRGETALALSHLAAALSTYERLGDQRQIVAAHARMGIAALAGNDRARATASFRQSLMLASAIGYTAGMVEGLDGLAFCAIYTQPLFAARIMAAARRIRDEQHLPVALGDVLRHQHYLRVAQDRSDAAAWAIAWEEGQRLAPTQAIAFAMSGL